MIHRWPRRISISKMMQRKPLWSHRDQLHMHIQHIKPLMQPLETECSTCVLWRLRYMILITHQDSYLGVYVFTFDSRGQTFDAYGIDFDRTPFDTVMGAYVNTFDSYGLKHASININSRIDANVRLCIQTTLLSCILWKLTCHRAPHHLQQLVHDLHLQWPWI